MQAASVAGRVLMGWIADRSGSSRRLPTHIGLLSALASVAIALFDARWPFLPFCGLAAMAGVFVSSWNGVQLSEIAKACPPERVREASAGATLIIFLGYVAAPIGFAMLLQATGRFDLGFFVCAAAGFGCFLLMRKA